MSDKIPIISKQELINIMAEILDKDTQQIHEAIVVYDAMTICLEEGIDIPNAEFIQTIKDTQNWVTYKGFKYEGFKKFDLRYR
jgi:hypothetical protein